MGNACVCPDTDEFVPAESSATEDLAKAELVDAVRDMADKGEADEDVETATGSEVFACEHISRSLSSVSALSLETSTPDFSGKWICCRVEGEPCLQRASTPRPPAVQDHVAVQAGQTQEPCISTLARLAPLNKHRGGKSKICAGLMLWLGTISGGEHAHWTVGGNKCPQDRNTQNMYRTSQHA